MKWLFWLVTLPLVMLLIVVFTATFFLLGPFKAGRKVNGRIVDLLTAIAEWYGEHVPGGDR